MAKTLCSQYRDPGWILVRELDSTCHGASKLHGAMEHVPQILWPECLQPVLHKRSHSSEKPSAAKK